METKKVLDKNGLEYYTGKIKQQIPKKTSDLTNDSNFIDNTYHDNSKQDTLVSGTNIKTINNESLLGSGDISVATTSDIPTKVSDLTNDSGFIDGLEILSYGNSTWNDFITAYQKNKVVYCRASSNSNPASGSQTRLAFMAYVNNATSPTEVEFQYYRSVSSHSDSQQGDQVFVYKLTSAGKWTVIVRNAFSKVVAGTGLSSSYSNGAITLSANSQTETDPVFTASVAHGIASSDITNWNSKQAALVSGTNIKTVNNQSLLGSGNISISGGVTSYNDLTDKPFYDASYLLQAVGSTITNEQYEELYNAISSNIVIKIGNSIVFAAADPSPQIVLSWVNYNQLFMIRILGDAGNHSVTYEYNGEELAFADDIPGDYLIDGNFLIQSIGSTITNEQYETLKNGVSAKGVIIVGAIGAILFKRKNNSIYLVVSFLIDGALHNFWISPIENDHQVTADPPKAVATTSDIPTKTSDLTNDSGYITSSSLPTKVSDLTNDSGYITGYTETDPVFTASAAHGITSSDITSWNNKSNFSGSYDDLTNKPTIPDELADLSDDSTHRVVTDAEKTAWNNKSDFSGSYNDLTDLPDLPVPTDIRINNSSIISDGVANLGVSPDYNGSTNPLATIKTVSQGMNAITSIINRKQDTLVSGTNIKTINNESILGSGNIEISGSGKVKELSSDFNAWDLEEGFYRTSSSAVISYHDDGMVNQDTLPAWTRLNVFRAIEPGDNEQYSAIWHLYIEVYAPTSGESIRKNIYYECSYRDITGEHYLGYGTKYSIIPTTNVKINGTSITSNGQANIVTKGVYNSSSNKIATMADVSNYVDDIVGDIESLLGGI